MRIFLYLLALLTGFSAADAARPVSASSAELGSVNALGVAIVVATHVTSEAKTAFPVGAIPPLATVVDVLVPVGQALVRPAPVERSDRSRE